MRTGLRVPRGPAHTVETGPQFLVLLLEGRNAIVMIALRIMAEYHIDVKNGKTQRSTLDYIFDII
jgi:hypothetical protein